MRTFVLFLGLFVTVVLPLLVFFAGKRALRTRKRLLLELRDGALTSMELRERGYGPTVYVELHRMDDDGLVTSTLWPGGHERGRLPYRLYHLTPKGRELADRLHRLTTWKGQRP